MIEIDELERIVVLRLSHGKVNAMDLELCERLSALLEQLCNSRCRAVVLTGNDRVFSAGVDLVRVMAEEPSYLDEFLPALTGCFRSIFNFPKPIVAAINGHAIAGGCILASACDQRLIHSRVRIGLPELRVGVPLPSIAIETIRFAVAPQAFQAMVSIGRNYRGQEAVDVGLADRLVDVDQLRADAIGVATELASIPEPVFALTKKQMRLPAMNRVAASESLFEKQIHEMWHSDEIRREIQNYVDRRL